ncbi:MAG: prenyltransferase [candidate division Zixibacteria bacterium]|jgi:1,4-dihydroxy-2-naphthoate octaprenyltransferase|nr:prenyltransferase [candidate division Zixibacteria bacterium]
MSAKILFLESRPQFLILSPILVVLGMSIALYNGNFNALYFVLSIIGLVLLHTSVNVLNDYSDYKTGIDLKVARTPFSGGSGILPAGKLSPITVLRFGLITFFLAVPIGLFFLYARGLMLLPIFLLGAVFVLYYTSHITRLGMGMPELAAGLGLGTLPVFGTFLIMNDGFSWTALYASVPSGFLVCNLLYLNEFPDRDADIFGGRKTLPIVLGYKRAAIIYSAIMILTYVWIIIGVIFRLMPAWTLLSLLTLPFAFKAIKGSLTFNSLTELVPAQGANVATVLLTQLLMGIGYILARVL